MTWGAWDSNLDGYMASNFTECNNILIASTNGALCTSRSKDNGPVPDANEIAALVKYVTSKQGSSLTYGGNKLMFTREIEDSISIFNLIGANKGALAISKTASNNFLVFACGAGPDKNSQAVGVNAVKCVEFLNKSL